MKKITGIIILSTLLSNAFSQESFFEVQNDSIIRLYFNDYGVISLKSNATYFRKLNKNHLCENYTGQITDYNLNNDIVFKSNLMDGALNGKSYIYDSKGQLLSEGNLSKNNYYGLWNFYYPNGRKKKVLDIYNDSVLINEFYSKKGKPLIINGNGYFNDDVKINHITFDNYEVKGKVKNGKLDGSWSMKNSQMFTIGAQTSGYVLVTFYFNDFYQDGIFVNGKNEFDYLDVYNGKTRLEITNRNKTHSFPVIKLVDFNPFVIVKMNESIVNISVETYNRNTIKSSINVNEFLVNQKITNKILFPKTSVIYPRFDGKTFFESSLSDFITNEITNYKLDKDSIFLLCQFRLNSDKSIEEINLISNSEMTANDKDVITQIIKKSSIYWESSYSEENGKKVDSYLFLPIQINDSKAIIGNLRIGNTSNYSDIFKLIEI